MCHVFSCALCYTHGVKQYIANVTSLSVSRVPQIDQLKQELSKKESELLALQTKLETLNNQNSDCKQHIEVLKESLTAKEQRAAILQTEVMKKNLPLFVHMQ